MRFTRLVAIVAIAFAILVLLPRAGLAWGPEGHRIVAIIADQLLRRSDPAVQATILALLKTDKDNDLTKADFADEATWADVLREKSEEARDAMAQWHSTRLKPDKPDMDSACFGHTPLPTGYPASHGPRRNCSVDKVLQFEAELRNPQTSSFERIAAVRFLLNLIGDLHDPLHAVDYGDQGGFCVAIQVGSKPPVRLSSYWQDTLVGEAAGPDAARGAARLLASIGTAELGDWPRGQPEAWAQETYEIAKRITYSFAAEQPAGKHTFAAAKGEPCPTVNLYRVGADHETKALAAVRTQLAKAGVRLAATLRGNFK
jgi:hypothetical protein